MTIRRMSETSGIQSQRITKQSEGRAWRRVAGVALAGSLAGVSCDTRFREAVVAGTTNYVYSTLLDPQTIADIVIQSTAGEQ